MTSATRARCVGSTEVKVVCVECAGHTGTRSEFVTRARRAILTVLLLLEGWPSGLRRTLGKRVYGKPYRGFESHSLRQISLISLMFQRIWRENPRINLPCLKAVVGRESPQGLPSASPEAYLSGMEKLMRALPTELARRSSGH